MSTRAVDVVLGALFRIAQVIALLFALAPVALVLYLSVFSDVFVNFPPKHLSLSLYHDLVTSPDWRSAIWVSFKVSVPAALLSVAIVLPAVLALERGAVPLRGGVELVILIPLLMPAVAYAVAFYVMYLRFGWAGKYVPLVLAEAVVTTPLAFLMLRTGARRIGKELDVAAATLGARPVRAVFDVTCRLLLPAALAAFTFSFMAVFDDALYVTFLGGPGLVTTSKAIFDSLRFAVDPVVAPLSAVLMVFMIALVGLATALTNRRGRV